MTNRLKRELLLLVRDLAIFLASIVVSFLLFAGLAATSLYLR